MRGPVSLDGSLLSSPYLLQRDDLVEGDIDNSLAQSLVLRLGFLYVPLRGSRSLCIVSVCHSLQPLLWNTKSLPFPIPGKQRRVRAD